MNLSTHQIVAVSTVAAAHLAIITTSTDLFHWFEHAVSGDNAVDDIEAKLSECHSIVASSSAPNSLLNREFAHFGCSLRTAYSTFGRDIANCENRESRLRVRHLALRLAADAFTRISTNARAALIRDIEAQALEPMSIAA